MAFLVGCAQDGPPNLPDAALDAGGADDIDAGSGGAADAAVLQAHLLMEDVSVLFPLPPQRTRDRLWGADEAGLGGPLLPRAAFDLLPPLTAGISRYEEFRVVAARFDPCFVRLAGRCESQVRLVLQPFPSGEPQSVLNASDAAVHTFYTLEPKALQEILTGLSAESAWTAQDARQAPLRVHSRMSAQGLEGPFARTLRALVLARIGASNLTRIAFMTRQADRRPAWKFGAFERAGAMYRAMTIARVEAQEQLVTKPIVDSTFDAFEVTPMWTGVDSVRALLAPSTTSSDAERRSALDAAVRLQNPIKFAPDQVDCASCHLAAHARARATELGLTGTAPGESFGSPSHNLAATDSPPGPDDLRAFGYLGTRAIISQRVANETAAVLNRLAASP